MKSINFLLKTIFITFIVLLGFSVKNSQATVYNIGTNDAYFYLGDKYISDIVILDPGIHVPITFHGVPIDGSDSDYLTITNGDGQVSFTGIADQLVYFDSVKYVSFNGAGYNGLNYGIECYSSPGTTKQDGIVIGSYSGYIEIFQTRIFDILGTGICTKFSFDPSRDKTWFSYTNPNYKAVIKDLRIWDNILESIDQHGIRLGEESVNTPYLVMSGTETVYCPRIDRPILVYHNHLDGIGKNGIALYGCYREGKIYSNKVINYSQNIDEDENPRCDYAAIVVGEGSFMVKAFGNTIRDGKGHGILDQGDGRSEYYNNVVSRAGYGNTEDDIAAFQMNQECIFDFPSIYNHLFYIYHNTIVHPKTYGISYTETITPRQHEVVYNIIALNDNDLNYFHGTNLQVAAYCDGLNLNSLYPTIAEANFVNPYSNNALLPTSSAINKVVDTSNPSQFMHPDNDVRHCNNGDNATGSCSICNPAYYHYRPKYRPDHGAVETPYRCPLAIVKPTLAYFGIKFPSLTKVSISGERAEIDDYIVVGSNLNDSIFPVAYWMWEDSIKEVFAYHDDSTGDGYVENSSLLFYYFDASKDKYIQLYAEYDSTFSNQGIFVTGDSCSVINLYQKQEIPLRQGWNIFSTYILPNDSTIEAVFKPIEGNLNLVCDYDTCYAPNQYDGIGTLEIGKAYKVNMLSADTLVIIGDGIVPELTPIPLNETNPDWNLLGVLRNTKTDIENVFENCINNIDHVRIIKNQDGIIYWPEYNLDFIDTMIPGQGYEVNMYASDTLLYLENDTLLTFKANTINRLRCDFFRAPISTGSNLALGIDLEAWDYLPNIGDEVAVINYNGEVTGCGVFNGENLAITVWGKTLTKLDNSIGMIENENLSLLLYNSQTNLLEIISVQKWLNNESRYKSNSVRIIQKLSHSQTPESNNTTKAIIYPNPVEKNLWVEIISAGDENIVLEVLNIDGKLVLKDEFNIIKGTNELKLDVGKLTTGSYTIHIKSSLNTFGKTLFVKY